MSLIFAFVVTIFLSMFPTAMVMYYRAAGSMAVITLILNILGWFTFGIFTIISFIVAAIAIGFKKTLLSILFAIFLIVLSFALIGAEIVALVSMFS